MTLIEALKVLGELQLVHGDVTQHLDPGNRHLLQPACWVVSEVNNGFKLREAIKVINMIVRGV